MEQKLVKKKIKNCEKNVLANINKQIPECIEAILNSLISDIDKMSERSRIDLVGKLLPYVCKHAEDSDLNIDKSGYQHIEELTVKYLKRVSEIRQP